VRICHIVNIGFEAGGAEKVVRLVSDGLRARGHDVNIISTDHRLQGQAAFADVAVPSIEGNAVSRIAGFFWHRKAYRQVKDAVARLEPDLVHLHTFGLFSPSVLDATAGLPRVITVQGPEDWTLELLSWNLNSRSTGSGRLSAGDRARYLYLRLLQRPAYLPRIRRVDRVLVPSRYFGEALRRDVGRVPTYVVPNGIELPPRAPSRDTGRLLFVGRLEAVKGATVLLEAFARVVQQRPDAQLTLIGRGTQRENLEDLVERLDVAANVRITGYVPDEELLEAYRDSTAVVIPSIGPENFPTVALEALAVGRPLIGTRVGGIPELIGHGDNGLLVEAGDVAALADAMSSLLDDPELAARMGARSAERAGEYSIALFLDRLEEHYREVINGRQARARQPMTSDRIGNP
jgi:glycosyltransferase involved in cell wall biosynthesis